MKYKLSIVFLALGFAIVASRNVPGNVKKFTRCELINELRSKYYVGRLKSIMWTCMAANRFENGTANNEKNLVLKNMSPCEAHDLVRACYTSCNELQAYPDEHFVACMGALFNQEFSESGDGFNAWRVYNSSCKGKHTEYYEGCDGGQIVTTTAAPTENSASGVSSLMLHAKITRIHSRMYRMR